MRKAGIGGIKNKACFCKGLPYSCLRGFLLISAYPNVIGIELLCNAPTEPMVTRTVLLIARAGVCSKRIDPCIFVILWPDAASDRIADDNSIITFRFEDARATH